MPPIRSAPVPMLRGSARPSHRWLLDTSCRAASAHRCWAAWRVMPSRFAISAHRSIRLGAGQSRRRQWFGRLGLAAVLRCCTQRAHGGHRPARCSRVRSSPDTRSPRLPTIPRTPPTTACFASINPTPSQQTMRAETLSARNCARLIGTCALPPTAPYSRRFGLRLGWPARTTCCRDLSNLPSQSKDHPELPPTVPSLAQPLRSARRVGFNVAGSDLSRCAVS